MVRYSLNSHFFLLRRFQFYNLTELDLKQGVGRKPEGKKTFERSRRRWKDNIMIYFNIMMERHKLGLSGLGQEKLAGCCECGNESSRSIKREGFFYLFN
jgi:hypothetical protein